MRITQKPTFKRAYKKLHKNQRTAVNEAIRALIDHPEAGERKVGDLNGVRVLKFDCSNQFYLLAYTASEEEITLLSIGPHENFYKKLKRGGSF